MLLKLISCMTAGLLLFGGLFIFILAYTSGLNPVEPLLVFGGVLVLLFFGGLWLWNELN